jgi:hypothetical protein
MGTVAARRGAEPEPQRDWAEAIEYATALVRRQALPVVDEPRITLVRGETARLCTVATSLRGYQLGGRLSWGDRHGAAVLATTQRVVLNHRLHGWTSFWLRDLRESTARLGRRPWTVDLSWHTSTAPLRLAGPSAPLLAVHVAAVTDPSGWTSHPGLEPVVSAIPRTRPATLFGSFHRLHPGVVVVLNQDIQSGTAPTRIRAGTIGVIVRREIPYARVQFDTGRAVLVDPACLDTVS